MESDKIEGSTIKINEIKRLKNFCGRFENDHNPFGEGDKNDVMEKVGCHKIKQCSLDGCKNEYERKNSCLKRGQCFGDYGWREMYTNPFVKESTKFSSSITDTT